MTAHPRVMLVLWKVIWDQLLMLVILRNMGMEIPIICLIYEMEDESTKHALLCYSRMRLIWRLTGYQPWRASSGP